MIMKHILYKKYGSIWVVANEAKLDRDIKATYVNEEFAGEHLGAGQEVEMKQGTYVLGSSEVYEGLFGKGFAWLALEMGNSKKGATK